jgi:hypothetical protein
VPWQTYMYSEDDPLVSPRAVETVAARPHHARHTRLPWCTCRSRVALAREGAHCGLGGGRRSRKGVEVHMHRLDKSPHVGHLVSHRKEYVGAMAQLLDRVHQL